MKMKRGKIKQGGSVILEALIAILIFSIGVLALVGMQASAISSVADAKYRSTAGFLADQIIGTIWASRLGNAGPNAANVMLASPDPGFDCRPCTSLNGNADTQAWIVSGVAANLPNGGASIVINATAVTVMVVWQPPNAAQHQHIVSTVID